MEKKFETIKRETVFHAPIFDIIEEGVLIPTGLVVTRYTVLHRGAAVFIPQAEDGSLLLVNQYRQSIRNSILEFPAGTLEAGEEPLCCAKREIVEEVGVCAEDWIPLGKLYPAPGFCDEIQHGYLARNLSPEQAPGDEDELIEVVRMSVSEVEIAIEQGQIADAKSVAFFFRARLKGLL